MGLLFHPLTDQQLQAIITSSSAAAYLFYGPKGIGKFSSSVWLAKRLNCPQQGEDNCTVCRLIEAGNYPDLLVVQPEKNSIGIEQIQALQRQLSLSRFYASGRRLIVIDQADDLTAEAQNCLLKTLEEPPRSTLIILIAQQTERLLPTVRSRLKPVYFPVLPKAQLLEYLTKQLKLASSAAKEIYEVSDGTIGMVSQLAEQPEAAKTASKHQHLAASLLQDSYFDRLITVGQLVSGGIEVGALASALGSQLQKRLRQGSLPLTKVAAQLEALAKLKRNLAANVNPKLALEGLMLEL